MWTGLALCMSMMTHGVGPTSPRNDFWAVSEHRSKTTDYELVETGKKCFRWLFLKDNKSHSIYDAYCQNLNKTIALKSPAFYGEMTDPTCYYHWFGIQGDD